MKQVTWVFVAGLLSIAPGAYSDDTERLIKRANRYFEPLPETMPGAENDTPEQIALGKELTDRQVKEITSFLKALSDKSS